MVPQARTRTRLHRWPVCGSGQTSRGRDLRAGTHALGYLIEPTASALETGTEYEQRTQTILPGDPRLRPARYVSLLMLKQPTWEPVGVWDRWLRNGLNGPFLASPLSKNTGFLTHSWATGLKNAAKTVLAGPASHYRRPKSVRLLVMRRVLYQASVVFFHAIFACQAADKAARGPRGRFVNKVTAARSHVPACLKDEQWITLRSSAGQENTRSG